MKFILLTVCRCTDVREKSKALISRFWVKNVVRYL